MLLRVSAAFFSLLSLKYLYISFFRSLPAPCLLPCSSCLLHSPGARPSVSLSPPSLPAFPPLALLSCSCRAFRSCRAVCPLSIGHAPKLSGGLPSCLLCLVVLWWLPSLVRHQAQDSMAVWADAARICPRPCLLLPMCCRVFRRLFRVLSRGFRPCVRVCVRPCVRVCVLPGVVWW